MTKGPESRRRDLGTGLALPPCHRQRRRTVTHTSPALDSILARSRSLAFRGRRGFTLIELLIVVVIIGILAAIAIPKFAATKGKANFATMESDLHNLTTAEESYFYDTAKYSNSPDSLKFWGTKGDVIVITEATATGWSATATHSLSYPRFCALFIGSAAPVPPAVNAGVVACQ